MQRWSENCANFFRTKWQLWSICDTLYGNSTQSSSHAVMCTRADWPISSCPTDDKFSSRQWTARIVIQFSVGGAVHSYNILLFGNFSHIIYNCSPIRVPFKCRHFELPLKQIIKWMNYDRRKSFARAGNLEGVKLALSGAGVFVFHCFQSCLRLFATKSWLTLVNDNKALNKINSPEFLRKSTEVLNVLRLIHKQVSIDETYFKISTTRAIGVWISHAIGMLTVSRSPNKCR